MCTRVIETFDILLWYKIQRLHIDKYIKKMLFMFLLTDFI